MSLIKLFKAVWSKHSGCLWMESWCRQLIRPQAWTPGSAACARQLSHALNQRTRQSFQCKYKCTIANHY
uniref:Uncharacterized protein n=1 Tax=Arundo donax TaxID=35708 RepID=A0A0A9FIL3_ARUDO